MFLLYVLDCSAKEIFAQYVLTFIPMPINSFWLVGTLLTGRELHFKDFEEYRLYDPAV
jgi:hypothetical protein